MGEGHAGEAGAGRGGEGGEGGDRGGGCGSFLGVYIVQGWGGVGSYIRSV